MRRAKKKAVWLIVCLLIASVSLWVAFLIEREGFGNGVLVSLCVACFVIYVCLAAVNGAWLVGYASEGKRKEKT